MAFLGEQAVLPKDRNDKTKFREIEEELKKMFFILPILSERLATAPGASTSLWGTLVQKKASGIRLTYIIPCGVFLKPD